MAQNENNILPPFSGTSQQFDAAVTAQQQFDFEQQTLATTADITLTVNNIIDGTIPIPVDVVNDAAPNYPSGKWVSIYAGNSATSTNFVNNGTNRGNIYWCLAVLPNDTTIDQIAVRCVVTNATDLVRVGIYSDVLGVPSQLLLDAGTVTIASLGTRAVSITPRTLQAGRYWVAVVFQSAATTSGAITGFTAGYTAPLYKYADNSATALGIGATNPCFYTVGATYTSGGLPASTAGIIFVDTSGTGLTTGPLVALRAA
jgi:hypothetical protein